MSTTALSHMEAERAFAQAARARRRASLLCRVRRGNGGCGALDVIDRSAPRRGPVIGPPVHAIPLSAIGGTVEPNRAAQFDRAFRPAGSTRARWERVWLAEHRGTLLPPISVVRVGAGYAVRDGHHRVSVARARGAVTIDAVVEG
jgi:hypothetical protein